MAIVKGAGLVMKAIIEVRLDRCYLGQPSKCVCSVVEEQVLTDRSLLYWLLLGVGRGKLRSRTPV